MSILFVCQGNICRSPAAERLLRRELADIGDVPVVSAGTNAMVGNPIDPPMVALLQTTGADTTDFSATQLNEQLIEAAELIITMTRRQRSVVVSLVPQALDRTFTLRELTRLTQQADAFASVPDLSRIRSTIDLDPDDFDVADPYRRGPQEYQTAFEQIRSCIAAVAGWLSGLPAAAPEEQPGEPVTVLESFREPGPQTNPYITMLAAALRQTPGLTVQTFTWRTALFGQYDVFHVHWPEILVTRPGLWRRQVHRLFFTMLLTRLRLRRIAVVRTQHNLAPHDDSGSVADRLLHRLDDLTTLRILINPTTPQQGDPSSLILHGHYRAWYQRWPAREPVPGRLAYFGLIRPYKGVEQLLEAFGQLPHDTQLSLTVSGRCDDAALADRLRRLAAAHPAITLELGFVSDEDLVSQVTSAQLVVLPYRSMHNSGGALAALSLDRPVLVPDTPASEALADEVGDAWVQRFTGTLTGDDLVSALQKVDHLTGEPDLSGRDWQSAGAAHRSAFGRAVRLRRGRTK